MSYNDAIRDLINIFLNNYVKDSKLIPGKINQENGIDVNLATNLKTTHPKNVQPRKRLVIKIENLLL